MNGNWTKNYFITKYQCTVHCVAMFVTWCSAGEFGDKCQIKHTLLPRDHPQYNCDRWHRERSLFRLISLTKYYGNACLHSWNSNYQHQYQFLCAFWCVNLCSLLLPSNCGNHVMSLQIWYCDRESSNKKKTLYWLPVANF